MSGRVLLPRFLSRCGAASRKAAEQAVVDGRVAVGGRVTRDVMTWVGAGASVTLDGEPVRATSAVWLALNKARGVVTTTFDPEGRPTVMDGLDPVAGLAPVGRLDRDSGGLLLLTNDHALAAALLDPVTHVAKRYRVKVKGHPSAATLARLQAETLVDRGESLGPLGVAVESVGPASAWLTVAISEGKNRQIRRRLDAAGHPVEVLLRVGFGPIALGALAPGASRGLTPAEVAALREFVTRR